MLLLSEEGRPIARRGAIKEAPVDVAKLDPLTPAAFVAIEDRRFYRHWGIDPRAHRPGDGRQRARRAGSARAAARSPSSSPRPASCRRDRTHQAQGAGGDHRLLARGLADQGRDPLALSVERLFRRRRLWPARRVAALFRPRAREPDAGAVGDAGGHGPGAVAAGADAQSQAARRSAAGWCCRRWPTPASITPARARATTLGAAGARSRRKVPTGTYFADWVAPAAQKAFEADFGEVQGARRRSTPTCSGSRCARSPTRRSATPRRRWWRCGPTGGSSRWSAARATRQVPFNRATQARRQPGSAFKLFVYLAALRAGWTPDSMIEDRPITIDGWTPGQQRRRLSRARSRCARRSRGRAMPPTVRLSESGRARQCACAPRASSASRRRCPNSPASRSAPPGVSLLELTVGLCRGRRRPLSGRAARASPSDRSDERLRGLLPAAAAALDRRRDWAPMLDLLWAAANNGTGRRAALAVPTFGKTGTTQDNRDALFVGFAGNLVVGVWVGRDDNKLARQDQRRAPCRRRSGATSWSRRWPSTARAGPDLPREFRVPRRRTQPRTRTAEPAARGMERRRRSGCARSPTQLEELFEDK